LDSNTFQLLIFGLSTGGGVLALILISILLAPRNPKDNLVKLMTYECGEVPIREGRPIFRIKYFPYAIYFTVFDVAIAFVIVFVAGFANLSAQNISYILLFFVVISIGLYNSWKLIGESPKV
jgi:NADH-quinone oxidoreductase subunit A